MEGHVYLVLVAGGHRQVWVGLGGGLGPPLEVRAVRGLRGQILSLRPLSTPISNSDPWPLKYVTTVTYAAPRYLIWV